MAPATAIDHTTVLKAAGLPRFRPVVARDLVDLRPPRAWYGLAGEGKAAGLADPTGQVVRLGDQPVSFGLLVQAAATSCYLLTT
jgi:hypothetical protein